MLTLLHTFIDILKYFKNNQFIYYQILNNINGLKWIMNFLSK